MSFSFYQFTQTSIQFIENNQWWAIPIVFLLAFGESLAIISLFVPATSILFGMGALIGSGVISMIPVLISASLGAVIGDTISYWLGKYYHQKVISSWPLNKHTKMFFHAEQFFHRWGVLSIFIGRFFGPLRAAVPLIAGTVHMPTVKFNFANITSAPIWVFILLAPGTFGLPWLKTLFS